MISAGWLVFSLIGGGFFGFVLGVLFAMNKRYFRIKAIVALSVSAVAIAVVPAGELVILIFPNSASSVQAYSYWKMISVGIVALGISCLTILEYQSVRNNIFGSTMSALAKYYSAFYSGESVSSRIEMVEKLRGDPDIDSSIFHIIARMEIARPSEPASESEEKIVD